MNFYTYLWLRQDGTPYYVGKGSGSRAFTSNGHSYYPPPTIDRIIVQDHVSETDAFEAEKFFIVFYGRKDLGTGILRNLTDGGEGFANPSDWARSRMRIGGLKAATICASRAGKIGGKISGHKAAKNGRVSRMGVISAQRRRAFPAYHRWHERIQANDVSCRFCSTT